MKLIKKYSLKRINNKPDEYEKDFIKIKFNSDDNVPSNKMLKLHNLTSIVIFVFQEHNKVFLDECLMSYKY